MVGKTRSVLSAINRASIAICSVSIAVMMAYGFVDVVGRYLFDRPLYGTYELSELLLAVVVFLSIASCQAEDRHMRVDFLLPYMSTRMRALIDGSAYACGVLICGFMAWYSIGPAVYSWEIGEHTEGMISFPVYPAKIVVPIGFALLGLQLAFDFLHAVSGAGRSDDEPAREEVGESAGSIRAAMKIRKVHPKKLDRAETGA